MKVAVIGSGVMGPGIAQVFMMGGHEVALNDVSEKALADGAARIRENLDLMHGMGLLDKGSGDYMPLLTTTGSLREAVEGSRLVVEAAPERPDVKQAIYNELDKICAEDAVIVSNTSSFPLPDMFPDFRPGRFFVAHFFNPPQVIPLVELVKSDRTDDGAVEWLKKELEACGKKTVVLTGYKMGFLVNRLQTAMMREAFHLIRCGVVKPEDVDTATVAAIGFKSAWQGTFDTMDYIGLDTVALACGAIFPDLSNDTGVPEMITEKVREGKLGVKTGQGFFNYEGDRGAEVLKRRQKVLLEQLKLWKKYMS